MSRFYELYKYVCVCVCVCTYVSWLVRYQSWSNVPIIALYFQAFNFDVTRIDWPHYLENYCLGVKKYVLKESMDTIDDARKALNR